jgi:GTP-binding protein
MKKRYCLALVGRPNVGKSALFNRLCGQRKAIVDDAEGTTRDRLYGEATFGLLSFDVIDTGGLTFDGEDGSLAESIERQAAHGVEEADVVVVVVDGTAGLNPLDREVVGWVREKGKRVIVAVNKIDGSERDALVAEFYRLGIEPLVAISAVHGRNIYELLEEAFRGIPNDQEEEEVVRDNVAVAIIGRPNVGKSTLLNALLGEDRSVVSPVAGTTRDAIEGQVVVDGMTVDFVDTAGIRKKNREREVVDKFAAIRTEGAIDQADICLLLIDATEGITSAEKRMAQMIEEKGKGCILVFNKWDLVKGRQMEHVEKWVRDEASFLRHCPAVFLSALKGRNVTKLFPLIRDVRDAQHLRVTTGQLNRFLEKATENYHAPMLEGGKRLRIYYMAQVETKPPTFVLFVNAPRLMLDTYQRYLVHQFRKTYQFTGNPLVFRLKARSRRDLSNLEDRSSTAPRR